MMRTTFFTQRKDIINGIENSDFINDWPYLFEITGMKIHFKELTGMDIYNKAMENKYTRVISYLKTSDKTGKMETIFREMEASSKNVADVMLCYYIIIIIYYWLLKV